MVFICNQPYPTHSKYETYFEWFPYPLSDFQKYAIEAVVEGHHVLTTAHTGSGKTLAAEFAIQHFTDNQKRVIYTSPIKALSNQKYYEFTRKYPHISFGLLTGDIKTNPNAQVLIMTTEILMNYLFTQTTTPNKDETDTQSYLSFQIDVETELGCVVFDEVHYINDEHRGQVWEQTILMLPAQVQMVMLSATIDTPEKFASWCENRYPDHPSKVYLASTQMRVVPLTHYGYVAANEGFLKSIKNKELEQKMRKSTNTIVKLQTEHGVFQEPGWKQIRETLELMEEKESISKRKFVLNHLATYLKTNEMLPAIAFVFSRKQVEMCASEITAALLEDDSKVPYTMKRECDQIIRKLPNYQEYLELPEYQTLVGLLEKGIGIHHSGMIPVLREIVELMISKGTIKLLFATESFAIGLDCPIRTAIFTSLSKFDGKLERPLLAHEYTQMAGRAGRRGIDTIGYVVHCNNLFPLPSVSGYKTILGGKPQTLVSKFHINYGMVLNLLKRGNTCGFAEFAHKSMLQHEMEKMVNGQRTIIETAKSKWEDKSKFVSTLRTPIEVCIRYQQCSFHAKSSVNKKRKELERELTKLEIEWKHIKPDTLFVSELEKLKQDWDYAEKELTQLETYVERQTMLVCLVLQTQGFLVEDPETHQMELTHLGKVASQMAEVHPLVCAELFMQWNAFENWTEYEIIGWLSCFVDVKVPEDEKKQEPSISNNAKLQRKMEELDTKMRKYQSLELELKLYSGFEYENALTWDLAEDMIVWAKDCNTELDCKMFLQSASFSTGDFTKACVKICTMAREWKGICTQFGYVELLSKLDKIDGLLLKYVATTQSLYV